MDLGRKITGSKYHARRKRKHYDKLGQESHASLGETKRKVRKVRGGEVRTILLNADEANVLVGKKVQPAKITNVEETPQNRFLARQNRLMKGAIITTSVGKARITNRPTREGYVNAVLIDSK